MFLSTACHGLFSPLSTFCLLHKILSMNSLFSSLFSVSCLISGSKNGSVRWPLSRGRQRCSFCFPFHSIPCLLSIGEIHQSLPVIKQHKHIYSPERDCSYWNPVSLTTLDQRQSVSIVYIGSKIKTSKNCKNNKQKAPNKQTEPPWANKYSDTELVRRSSLRIQCSGVTGSLNCCVNIHALWQLCCPGIWQLSEPGKSLTHSLTAVTNLPQNKATICLCKETSYSV